MPAVLSTMQATPVMPIFLDVIPNTQLVNKEEYAEFLSSCRKWRHAPHASTPLPAETAEKRHWCQGEPGASADPARSIQHLKIQILVQTLVLRNTN